MRQRSYLERALAVNPEFPNTHLGLGILSDNSGNHTDAFHHYLQALKFNPKHDELFERTMGNIVELCSRIFENDIGNDIIEKYKTELETRSGVKI
jgi:tetratricopeptide (TPR) repeat protein